MKKRLIIILFIIALIVLLFYQYTSDYYKSINIDEYLTSSKEVNVIKNEYGYLFDGPGEDKAIIFYPGAKIEYTAYSELLYKIASSNIDCFMLEMPYNLAIFDINKANKIINNYKYDSYIMMGHSLGGAMASIYTYNNQDKIDALILLSAYSTKNLSNSNIKVLSIYGTNDKVLNINSYNKYKNNLPKDYKELIIKGSNHSSYASYGLQKGDGLQEISKEEEYDLIINEIQNTLK